MSPTCMSTQKPKSYSTQGEDANGVGGQDHEKRERCRLTGDFLECASRLAGR